MLFQAVLNNVLKSRPCDKQHTKRDNAEVFVKAVCTGMHTQDPEKE